MRNQFLSPSKTGYVWILICIAILGIGLWLFNSYLFIPVAQKDISNENSKVAVSQKNQSRLPHYTSTTLKYVKAFGKGPEKQVGGRKFQNREGKLPKQNISGKTIYYREWDVHPYVKGKSRGPERLITGSDGSAYYTHDHYQNFIKIE